MTDLIISHWEFVLAAVLVGALAAGAACQRGLSRALARARARRVTPTGPITAASEGRAVCLRGVLRASDPLPTDTQGAPLAAITTSRREGDPLAITRRAVGLTLEVDGAPVELAGPVEVATGSRETPAKSPLELAVTRAPALVRSLAPGDSVHARGVLRRVGRADVGYRESASRWVLDPLPPEGDVRDSYIVLHATDRYAAERVSLRQLAPGALAGAAAAVFALGVAGSFALDRVAFEVECDSYLAPAPDLPYAVTQVSPFHVQEASELRELRRVWRCPDGD